MPWKWALLPSDYLLLALALCVVWLVIRIRRVPHLRQPWQRVLKNKLGMVSLTILLCYAVVGLLDSIHIAAPVTPGSQRWETRSVLDRLVQSTAAQDEVSYSAPFATQAFTKSLFTVNGHEQFGYAPLQHAGSGLAQPQAKQADILRRSLLGVAWWSVCLVLSVGSLSWLLARRQQPSRRAWWGQTWQGQTTVCWREIFLTVAVISLILFVMAALYQAYHIMGTDKVGHDVFYATIKSIRTGLIIGTLTTLVVLPFALVLGMVAGYFAGWLDDLIQFVYTTLSSIPAVLLISATILVLQAYFDSHVSVATPLAERADVRLLMLCLVLGLTGWAGLCRLLRAETFKLRELEFVQAARVLGVGRGRILFRHILPNLFHLVLITLVLDFSGLVLAEAVLTYVGVGVDPTTFSWGNMINSSRLELAREPMVWWPLGGALLFMFFLVLSANFFADAVRDALDPRLSMDKDL